LLPIIEKIDDRDRLPQALILVPTRELAHQIGREFEKLSFGRRIRAAAVVGGESMFKQVKLLQSGCQIVVATPGRLMDLMDRQAIRLDRVKFVVLDEADQMLDIGFRPAVESILEACPKQRQTYLLSATMPREVRDLTRRYMVNPVDVRLIHEDEDATIPAIRQAFIMVAPERKLELLFRFLERDQPTRAIVFCRTKHGADRVGNLLRNDGVKAEAMHGDLSQGQRNRVLAAFRAGRLTTLVATDVVGRGIDVPGISHVVNFDIPEDPEHYVHRIGRTGRMGKDGAAVTFVLPDQGKLLDQIEKSISRKLDQDQVDGVPSINRPQSAHPKRQQGRPFGGGGGGRGRRGGPPRRGNNAGNGNGGGGPLAGGIKKRRFGSPQRTS
jgi:ATP-dependent RNA helicase DeaD